ncbi:MAG: enoyl-CoA hydratase-related protein [Nocardioides sp.]|uniref:enoyl-CoA hydratase-related protein n=1 Tax=Nocardioides sp. TaxID=35761 RepID=UPI003266CF4C
MAEPAATLEKRGCVALITLNRPAAMNAVNGALSAAVGEALAELDADDDLRVGIITGRGRAFCAGADLKALGAGEDLMAEGHPEWGFAGFIDHDVRKPVIAAVNGIALGGGAEIVLRSDLAVMGDEASLGLPEVARGFFAAAGGLIMLPRQVPAKIAMEAALSGQPISAADALRWGLVNRVVPTTDVLDVALALAATIGAHAPLAVMASKRLVQRSSGSGSDWDAAVWQLNSELAADLIGSDDAREGMTAFAEKRPPRWTGK